MLAALSLAHDGRKRKGGKSLLSGLVSLVPVLTDDRPLAVLGTAPALPVHLKSQRCSIRCHSSVILSLQLFKVLSVLFVVMYYVKLL